MLSLASVTAPPRMSVQEVNRAVQLYEFVRSDSVIKGLMNESNENSVHHGHVFHGWPHAQEVEAGVLELAAQLEQHRAPVRATWYDVVVAGTAALLHDVGRSLPVDSRDKLRWEHHGAGAKIADQYLKDAAYRLWGDPALLPEQFRRDVVWIIAHHGAHTWIYKTPEEKIRRQREIQSVPMGLVLIADKTAGSEVRVPATKLRFMHHLARRLSVGDLCDKYGMDPTWTLARLFWGCKIPEEIPECARTPYDAQLYQDAEQHLIDLGELIPTLRVDGHDHVNGAITGRKRNIVPDEEPGQHYWGTFVYQLVIDERIADQKLVTGLDWWNDAFRVIAKALKFFGLRLLLEFNGRPLMYEEQVHDWVPAPRLPYIPKAL